MSLRNHYQYSTQSSIVGDRVSADALFLTIGVAIVVGIWD